LAASLLRLRVGEWDGGCPEGKLGKRIIFEMQIKKISNKKEM